MILIKIGNTFQIEEINILCIPERNKLLIGNTFQIEGISTAL